jgi:hypothetical protein
MEDNPNLLESLVEKAAEYGKTNLELVKLKAVEKVSDTGSSLLLQIVVVVIISTFVLFLNIGLAFWLGDVFGKTSFGFLAVAGFYLIAGILVWTLLGERIKRMFANYIIRLLLK